MSSYDITFCGNKCNREDCRRNLKFQRPFIKVPYISMAIFDDKCEDMNHENCDSFWEIDKPEKKRKK